MFIRLIVCKGNLVILKSVTGSILIFTGYFFARLFRPCKKHPGVPLNVANFWIWNRMDTNYVMILTITVNLNVSFM